MADAMNSLVLRMNVCYSSGLNMWRHPMHVLGQKPPMPSLDKSENILIVGFLKTALLINMPSSVDLRKSRQRFRSSMAPREPFVQVVHEVHGI